jgi:hypothetical protein
MPFDPFGIQQYHEMVRQKIMAGEPGYAQTVLGEVLVSYEAASFGVPVYIHSPCASNSTDAGGVLTQMIIDVARGEAVASPRCFSRERVVRLVGDFAACPETFNKPRRISRLLSDFYLEDGAAGARLLY